MFVVEKERGFQLRSRFVFILTAFDYRDNFVDIGKRDNETFDYMLSFSRSRKVVFRTSFDNVDLVIDEVRKNFFNVENLRVGSDKREKN